MLHTPVDSLQPRLKQIGTGAQNDRDPD